MTRIAHIDINSYFATVLQQENPRLQGKPLGILKDTGRTCIIAASKEAKARGITTGCHLREARSLVPELITLPAKFSIYLDFTKRLKKVFCALAPRVDIFSLDEAFIDLSDCHHLYPDPIAFGKLAQKQIKAELGEWVTANVGISYTRLLAKLAGEVSPKGSVTEITPENKDSFLMKASFKDICGVGRRLEHKLKSHHITHPYELNFCTFEELEPLVGALWAKELLRIARGEDSSVLRFIDMRRDQEMKSVGRTITGFKLTDSEEVIQQTLYNLCEEVISKVRQMDMAGRHVAAFLMGENKSWYRHVTLKHYVSHTPEFFHLLYDEFYRAWQRDFKVIRFGVFLGGLKKMNEVPIPLFPTWHKQEQIHQALDQINQKYGLFTIRPATLTNCPLIRPEVTGFLGDRKYHGL